MKTILILQLIFALVFGIGWIMNLIRLINCDFDAPYKAEVIYVIGTFTPTCIVTGWIDLED